MQECPKCKSAKKHKDGIVKQKQRYRCKKCNYRFTVVQVGKSLSKRRAACILYLAGFDLRKIGKFINTSHVSIHNWIKNLKDDIKQLKGSKAELMQIESLKELIKTTNNKKEIKGYLLLEFTDKTINFIYTMEDM